MPSTEKSTIVRPPLRQRATLHAADLLAPSLAARWACDLWFRVPPRLPAVPLPPHGELFSVVSKGVTVRGQVWGEGPVVYLVHGWGGRASQFASYVEPLVAAGHRVVLFDAPGHGDSDPGRHGRGRTHGVEMGQALDEVFARFGPAHAVLAHSLGTIATYLTLRFGWLSTQRLVLLAPMVEAATLFDGFWATLGFGRRARRAFDRRVDAFVSIPLTDFDARIQASHVDAVPTLVVHDRTDLQTPYGDAVSLVDSLPFARLVTTEGLGHRRILQDQRVIETVLDFLADREVSAAA